MDMNDKERFRQYHKYVYETGAISVGGDGWQAITGKTLEKDRKNDFESGLCLIIKKRILAKEWRFNLFNFHS